MFEITSTEIPTRKRAGRTPLPNPFTDHFPADDKAISLVVPFPQDSVEVRRLRRQARIAANAVDRSPQFQAVEAEADTDSGFETQITVWTIDRITRD